MTQKRAWTQILAEVGDLEENLLPRVPVIEIAGNQTVTVEGHGGIIEFDTTTVMFHAPSGTVQVRGNDLLITKMTRKTLVIHGNIVDVNIEPR